jgi:hypothetical protein
MLSWYSLKLIKGKKYAYSQTFTDPNETVKTSFFL